MKVVIQRVKKAHVEVDHLIINQIDHGLLVYVGIHENDHESMIPKMANKILNLRIFEDDLGKMNQSVLDHHGSILLISQFTLYGDAKGGHRPSFTEAARPDQAHHLYTLLENALSEKITTKGGQFQAHMHIHSINDGPVTIIYEL